VTDRRSFAARLLAWFDANRRDLPWRATRDPWAIWVSEVMLQQTRVAAVREAYGRFLHRFPTAATFAAASDDDLLLAWRGLGYYRRARLLRDGARAVVERHGGAVPRDTVALGELPGVGDYTRGAVASIAFGAAEPAVDGNVERVIARHRGVREDVKSAPARQQIRGAVSRRLDRERPGDFNQALMELGALVCTPTSPACDRCPVAGDCEAAARGLTGELPARRAPRPSTDVSARVGLATRGGTVLAARVPAGEPNAGQVELPGAGILQSTEVRELAGVLRTRFSVRASVGDVLASVRHAITHHRITLHAHAIVVRDPGRLAWFPIDEATPWTTASRKVFRAALGLRAMRT
jgi:A/G-specific adenine glycosylase